MNNRFFSGHRFRTLTTHLTHPIRGRACIILRRLIYPHTAQKTWIDALGGTQPAWSGRRTFKKIFGY
jgi:hypothetical protein